MFVSPGLNLAWSLDFSYRNVGPWGAWGGQQQGRDGHRENSSSAHAGHNRAGDAAAGRKVSCARVCWQLLALGHQAARDGMGWDVRVVTRGNAGCDVAVTKEVALNE